MTLINKHTTGIDQDQIAETQLRTTTDKDANFDKLPIASNNKLREFYGPPDDFKSKKLDETKKLVAEAIDNKLKDNKQGLSFFKSGTGTGKTLGFCEYIASSVNSGKGLRFAVLVPTMNDVNNIYLFLASLLDNPDLCVPWSSAHDSQKPSFEKTFVPAITSRKKDLKKAQIIVLTHSFGLKSDIGELERCIGHRDLVLVDEIPDKNDTIQISLATFASAKDEALQAGEHDLVERFSKAQLWADKMFTSMIKLRENGDMKKYSSVLSMDSECLNAWQNYKLDQFDLDGDNAKDVVKFMNACMQGTAFVGANDTNRSKGMAITFNLYDYNMPHSDKAIIFSATAELEGFQIGPHAASLKAAGGTSVDYKKMKIVRVPWLKSVDKYITKAASSDAQRAEIKAHIKKIIESTEVGSEVLVVIAKSLAPAIAHMLYENLDAHCVVVKSSHEIELMREFDALGRKVHILTHGRGVGDNAYRNCSEVIVYAPFYRNEIHAVAETLVYSEVSATEENLKDANSVRLRGKFEQVRSGQLVGVTKQEIARGTCRFIDDDGVAFPMRAWLVFSDTKLHDEVSSVFPNSQIVACPDNIMDEFKVKESWDIVERLKGLMLSTKADEITTLELNALINTVRKHAGKLLGAQSQYRKIGWELVPSLGRGKKGMHCKRVD